MPLDLAQARSALLLLERHFFSRTDLVAVGEGRGRPQPASGNLRALLATHLLGAAAKPAVVSLQSKATIASATMGHFRVGSYCLAADNTVRWLCLDFDGGTGHANGLADPTAAALAAHREAASRGIPAYLERSGGGHGWHLWVFFGEPVAAAKARRLGFTLAPRDAILADGRMADPESSLGIEVFPKQERIAKGGVGNLVWLPWWASAAPGGNVFVRVVPADAPGPATLEPYLPESFDTVGAAHLDEIIASLDAETASRRVATSPAPVLATDPSIDLDAFQFPPDEASASPDWRAWRAKAVAALRLEDVYGPWLTGAPSSPGWLQCRDPWSPSGDRNPSAGVADGASNAERGTFHSFRTGQSLSVFDFLVKAGRVGSFADALKHVASLVRVPMPERQAGGSPARQTQPGSTSTSPADPAPAASATARPPKPGYPEVVTNGRQTRDIIRDAWNALIARNSIAQPFIFQRGGQIVRLRRWDRSGPLMIEALDDIGMFSVLVHQINWLRVTEEAKMASVPSKDIARAMLSSPDQRLPSLSSVMTTPGFGADGQLIRTNGYHASDEVWFDAKDKFDLESIPDAPTPEDIAAARSLLLDDLAVDFPFASHSDRAHFLAALLLPFVRRLIPTSTPLHLFEAPSVGSGKSLLCAAIAMVTSGHDLATSSVPDQEEEFRKVITSKLLVGSPIILLDNARERKLLDSPSLAAALTSTTWVDRVLGTNKVAALPNLSSWFLTGNNPRLSMELLRRSVRIRLNPRRQRAWQRDEFRHDPLLPWVRANRGPLVKACLTLIQAWVAAGKPPGRSRLGSFETWAFTLGGILDVAGVPGFLGNLNEIYDEADTESQEWIGFVSEWWDRFGPTHRKVSELLALCEERELLVEVRGTGTDKSQQARLGKALAGTRDQIFGSYRIDVAHDPRLKTKSYRLRRINDGSDPGKGSDPALDLFGPDAPEPGVGAAPEPAACHGVADPTGDTPSYPAVGHSTYRKPTANANQAESATEEGSAVGAVGCGRFFDPYAGAHACTQAHAHAHACVGTPGNLPHLPQGTPNASQINDLGYGRSSPTSRQPTATSRGAPAWGSPPIDLAAFDDPDPGGPDPDPGDRYRPDDFDPGDPPDHPPDFDPEDDP